MAQLFRQQTESPPQQVTPPVPSPPAASTPPTVSTPAAQSSAELPPRPTLVDIRSFWKSFLPETPSDVHIAEVRRVVATWNDTRKAGAKGKYFCWGFHKAKAPGTTTSLRFNYYGKFVAFRPLYPTHPSWIELHSGLYIERFSFCTTSILGSDFPPLFLDRIPHDDFYLRF